ncbi:MAG: hypothetical protein JJ969_12405 [Rhizobiaceae bacterium]|nr:hypothetical protein [Rhizobiaceae bacterium]
MRVDDWVQRTVVYLGLQAAGNFLPLGTAFLIGVVRQEKVYSFIATARHVVESVAGDVVWVRVNKKAGGSDVLKLAKSDALLSPNAGDDLAIFPITWGPDVYDYRVFTGTRADQIAVDERLGPIGLGDEVFAVGLYTSHYGLASNAPIVRIGHVSALPKEPIPTKLGYTNGYIIELRSIAGLSGSPVFHNVFPIRTSGDGFEVLSERTYRPIGLLLGHHIIESREDQIAVGQYQSRTDEPSGPMPPFATEKIARENTPIGPPAESSTGLCVIVPIGRIFDMLDSAATDGLMASIEQETG